MEWNNDARDWEEQEGRGWKQFNKGAKAQGGGITAGISLAH